LARLCLILTLAKLCLIDPTASDPKPTLAPYLNNSLPAAKSRLKARAERKYSRQARPLWNMNPVRRRRILTAAAAKSARKRAA
jgi:hypothetical protein